MRLPILYLDDDVVALDKPVGLSSHAAWYDVIPTDIVGIVKAQLGADYLGIHQRLDRDTSGVMVFARRPNANAWLSDAFQDRTAGKEYLAVVQGAPPQHGRIDAPIAPVGSGRQRVVPPSVVDPRAQPAVTEYSVIARSPDRRLSLLRLRPLTGRTHQLRVHLAHIGTPIVGDTLYDSQARFFPRLLLHAHRLSLTTPTGPLRLEAPVPGIFESLVNEPGTLTLRQEVQRAGGLHALLDEGSASLMPLLVLADERRRPIANDDDTTAYRLLNGAGDGIPDLTVDRYGDVLLVRSPGDASASVLPLADKLWNTWQPRAIVRGVGKARATIELVRGEMPDGSWEVSEADLRYVVGLETLERDLPTELREMRARVRALAAGRTVLNLFAERCAFGVAATTGSAARVLNLDPSRQQLNQGMASYAANGLAADRYDFVDGDILDWLRRFQRRGERFDLVIVAPPPSVSPRPSRRDVERDWQTLAQQAAAVVAPGGLLLACSRQPRLTRRHFKALVLPGAGATGRSLTEIAYWRDSALDFSTMPEYDGILKGLLLRAYPNNAR